MDVRTLPDSERSPHAASEQSRDRRPKLMLFGLLFGLVSGLLVNIAIEYAAQHPNETFSQWLPVTAIQWSIDNVIEPVGRVFLRLILSVVLPLVFSALVLAVVEFRDLRRLGRLGLAAIVMTVIFSAASVLIGLTLVTVAAPGKAMSVEKQQAIEARFGRRELPREDQVKRVPDIVLDLIPENPLQEAVGALDGSSKGNGMLAIMVFALVLGAATIKAETRGEPWIKVLDSLYAVSMIIVDWAMTLAPFGVACLMFVAGARLGIALVVPLLGFLLVVVGGLLLQMFVIYPAALWISGVRPSQFFRNLGPVIPTAFGTASSSVTLPTAIQVAERNLLIPSHIARFILTVGATGNQNGTALYEGVVVLFLAQVFGADLTIWQQLGVVLFAILAGIGTAGIPGGSIPMIMIILASIGVPPESVALILGLDRFLDMCRTVVNVTGDLTIAQCVAAWSGHLPKGKHDGTT
ncbi:MAG: dicarboxylate/amino acid:cation symporter [Thermogutta sp.]